MQWSTKRGDTAPPIRAQILSPAGAPVDLTGASVRFLLAAQAGGTPLVDGTATIVDAAQGIVEYAWAPGDLQAAGQYLAEFEVTWPDGRVQTYPGDGYITVAVVADLG